MLIQETSRTAFKETNLSREAMCKRLHELYKSGSYTDREVSRLFGWNPSEVSARRNDLYSIVQQKGKRRDPVTGKLGKVWGLFNGSLF